MTRDAVLTEPESIEDARPLAVRRKRRASTGLGSPRKAASTTPVPVDVTRTPVKAKKKVRFSDPGPQLLSPSSTGITPFIQRSSLQASFRSGSPSPPRLFDRAPRRRRSLPSLSTALHTASALDLSSPIEVQFAPLRQVLDERVKRRIRRNKLSEEINDIEYHRRDDAKRRGEIRHLKQELALALAREQGEELVGQVQNDAGNAERIRELEVEIGQLREEMRGRSMTAEPDAPFSPVQENDTNADDGEDIVLVAAAASSERMSTSTNSSSLSNEEAYNALPPAVHLVTAAVQTEHSPDDASCLEDHIRAQTEHLVRARLELEHLCPGETTLGLTPCEGNSAPVLDALLDRLRALKSKVDTSSKALSASRTQEGNLRAKFNIALLQLERARSRKDILAKEYTALAAQLQATQTEMAAQAESADQKDRSLASLSAALDSYRGEVKGLEQLVTRMEADHAAALATVQTSANEAISDLECRVAAETRGRREGEEAAATHLLRIRALDNLAIELKAAMAEKQALVRSLEEALARARASNERETGALNVRVAEQAAALDAALDDLAVINRERTRLARRLGEEKEAGDRVLRDVLSEARRVEGLCGEYVAGVEARWAEDQQGGAVEWKGLLTPTDAVRFRDAGRDSVEGYVELGRGAEGKRMSRAKRGIDSGIGMMEEDERDDTYADDLRN